MVNLFQDNGFHDAVRNYADKAVPEGVDVYAGNMVIQVKSYKGSVPISKFREIKVMDKLRALVSKTDREPWMITMTLEDFFKIAQDVGELYDIPFKEK